MIEIGDQWVGLESKHLRAFLEVADTLHFGRAAERVGITQSALSTQIRRLEDILGGALFTRGRRAAVVLTAAGHAFLPDAADAVARLDRAARVGQLITKGEAGPATIGYVFSAAMSGLLSRMLTIARTTHPERIMSASPMDTPDQITAIIDAKIDVGIIRPRRFYPPGIHTRLVHREPIVLAAASSHPLAAEQSVTAAALSEETFLIPQIAEGTGPVSVVAEMARRAGFAMPRIVETSDFVTAACMAASGSGVVLAPRSLTNLGIPGLRYIPIDGSDAAIDLVMIWRGDQSPLIAALSRGLPSISAEDSIVPGHADVPGEIVDDPADVR